MKKILTGLAFVAALAMTGCGAATSTGGNPQNKKEQFTIKSENLTISQGETKKIKLTASRGEEVKGAIGLDFKDDKDGLEIKAAANEIAASTSDVEVTITAKPKADVGEHHIEVTGKLGSLDPSKTVIKVTVKEVKETKEK